MCVFGRWECIIIICDDDSRFRSYMRRIILDAGLKEKEAVFAEYASGEALADALDIVMYPVIC